MKKEQIEELFEKFESACTVVQGVECWSARELQEVFGYKDWRNFIKTLKKAQESCENAEVKISDHFVGHDKMVEVGSGAKRKIKDFALTRYACYLVAQNGDPSKTKICMVMKILAKNTLKIIQVSENYF